MKVAWLGVLAAAATAAAAGEGGGGVGAGLDAGRLDGAGAAATAASRAGRYGRFLHITDLHPDPHYVRGAHISSACHVSHKKEKKKHGGRFPPLLAALRHASLDWASGGEGGLISWLWTKSGQVSRTKADRAGHYGAPGSICDSPPPLISASLRWIVDNWLPTSPSHAARNVMSKGTGGAEETDDPGLGFDFILVTGDLARHDVDSLHYPRTLPEIYRSNRWTMTQIERAFPGIPIVPCVGNNDIYPHNIMQPGPSPITRELANIWSKHIPEFEVHNFQRGAYFAKEVIPNELAVLSLNTIYLYDSNKVVDGCVKSKKSKEKDAGTIMLDWMEVQLSLFRSRGMQVHIMGHVPPTAGNYFPLCYERYTDIVLRYQDTIVGQHFGHMNVDAFFVQEDEEAVFGPDSNDRSMETHRLARLRPRTFFHTSALSDDLQDDYATLPGRKRTNLDYYHAFFAVPSIVPTFLPTVRVYTYNNTRAAKSFTQEVSLALQHGEQEDDSDDEDEDTDDLFDADQVHTLGRNHRRRHRKHKKRKHRRRKLPRYASPNSPARTNTYLSLLGYSQWVLDLDRANAEWEARHADDLDAEDVGARRKEEERAKEESVEYELEYVTYEPEMLWSPYLSAPGQGQQAASASVPVPKALLDRHLERLGVAPPHYLVDASASLQTGGEDGLSGWPRWRGRIACAFRESLVWLYLSSPSAQSRCAASHAHDDAIVIPSTIHASHKLRLPKAIKHLTDYGMASLTVEPMMELARRLASDRKLWKRFVGRMYQGLPGGR